MQGTLTVCVNIKLCVSSDPVPRPLETISGDHWIRARGVVGSGRSPHTSGVCPTPQSTPALRDPGPPAHGPPSWAQVAAREGEGGRT